MPRLSRNTHPWSPKKMIKETTLTGTPEELQERVRKMKELGVSQACITGGEQEMTDFATHVVQAG